MTSKPITTAIVTTGRAGEQSVEHAKKIARKWRLPYYERQGRSIAAVRKQARHAGDDATAVIVVHHHELSLYIEQHAINDAHSDIPSPDHVFRYHPGMGVNRLRRLMNGERDWMIDAMALQPGDRILDATMGLGSDLLVASYVVGDKGVAVGLESQLLLALMVSEGTQTYVHSHHEEITRSIRRIQVMHVDYHTFLDTAPPKSFDVVYFDPMFERPVTMSHQMMPMWILGNHEPLDPTSIDKALQVATRRVVVKDRPHGPYATSGWFDRVIGGKGSRIVYCIAES